MATPRAEGEANDSHGPSTRFSMWRRCSDGMHARSMVGCKVASSCHRQLARFVAHADNKNRPVALL